MFSHPPRMPFVLGLLFAASGMFERPVLRGTRSFSNPPGTRKKNRARRKAERQRRGK